MDITITLNNMLIFLPFTFQHHLWFPAMKNEDLASQQIVTGCVFFSFEPFLLLFYLLILSD